MLNNDMETQVTFQIVQDTTPDEDGDLTRYIVLRSHGVTLELAYTDETNATYFLNNFHNIMRYFISRNEEESSAVEEFESEFDDFIAQLLEKGLTDDE
jgi:hypothetical protein